MSDGVHPLSVLPQGLTAASPERKPWLQAPHDLWYVILHRDCSVSIPTSPPRHHSVPSAHNRGTGDAVEDPTPCSWVSRHICRESVGGPPQFLSCQTGLFTSPLSASLDVEFSCRLVQLHPAMLAQIEISVTDTSQYLQYVFICFDFSFAS